MISHARLRANQCNAKHSGQGFAHTPDDLAAVAHRAAAWSPSLGPVGPREEWLVEQMAGASVRIDRCRTEEQALRSRSAVRAGVCWDDDQRQLAEEIGARLARDPSRVLQRLRQSVQGCEWLF